MSGQEKQDKQGEMLFGPQRGSVLTIFDKFLSTFGVPAIVIVLALLTGNMMALLENAVILAILLANPVMQFVGYICTYYAVDGDRFYVKSGLFNKKSLELPLDRITTVEFSQNLIFQWTDVYSIKVDNGSNYGGSGAGKVTLALKRQEAVKLKELLLTGKEAVASEEQYMLKTAQGETISYGAVSLKETTIGETVTVPVSKILIMGALQSKGNALARTLSAVTVLTGMGNVVMDSDYGMEQKLVDMILAIPGLAMAAIIVLAFILLTTALGAVFAFVKYYGFTIRQTEEAILLQYGLLTKKNHSLLKDKISGVEYIQSLPMRWMGVGYLNVMAVGYGDDAETDFASMMYPLIKTQDIKEFLQMYIPELALQQGQEHKPLAGSLGYFFLCFRVFFVIVLTICFILANQWIVEYVMADVQWLWFVWGILLVLVCVSVVMEYRTVSIQAGSRNVQLTAGVFSKTRTIVKAERIESISDTASALKRRKGIVTISVGVLAPVGNSVKRIRNLHFEAYESIRYVMRY